MKKTAAIVGGALAVIAAVAALITNAQTIGHAVVSAYHWATGEHHKFVDGTITGWHGIHRRV
jgi:hypothetical protein